MMLIYDAYLWPFVAAAAAAVVAMMIAVGKCKQANLMLEFMFASKPDSLQSGGEGDSK